MTFRKLVLVLPILLISCGTSELEPDNQPRGGKADHELFGSCEESCDGESSDGNCWCDDQCASLGDCCEDMVEVCNSSACEDSGGTCVAGLSTCLPHANPSSLSCGDTPIETTCCIPEPATECDSAGGICISGLTTCPNPTSHSCGDTFVGTTCCMPGPPPTEGASSGGTCVAGLSTCLPHANPSSMSCGDTPIEMTCCVPEPADTCYAHCGGSSADESCYCDTACEAYGDCCADKSNFCG